MGPRFISMAGSSPAKETSPSAGDAGAGTLHLRARAGWKIEDVLDTPQVFIPSPTAPRYSEPFLPLLCSSTPCLPHGDSLSGEGGRFSVWLLLDEGGAVFCPERQCLGEAQVVLQR